MIINAAEHAIGTQGSREYVAMEIQNGQPIFGALMIHVTVGRIGRRIHAKRRFEELGG